MSEEILIQKKKKKLDVKDAIRLLKPFAENWKQIDKETAEKFHDVYMSCEHGIWKYVLEGLGIPSRSWYNWLEKYELDVKQPHPEGSHEIAKTAILDDEESESERARAEDEQETEYDTIKYQETYSIIDRFEKLTKNMFKVVEKEELIKKHETALKKQTGLHVMLESE